MMSTRKTRNVAILWQADRDMRNKATVGKSRLSGIANALSQVGIEVEAAVYADEFMEEVRDQLSSLDGVLVWVNPVEKGRDRSVLDEMLKQVADKGIYVSAHPEIIQKMGTKEVLFKTRNMNWGCDTHLYTNLQQFREQFPQRLTEGMVRCYLAGDKVVGFGEQLVNALYPASPETPPGEVPQPGPRLYYPASRPDLQRLKTKMEEQWLPAMQELLDIETQSLPVIWDADFLYGPKDMAGEDTYVLCEINVSAVFPFPDEALAPLAQETLKRIT